MLADKLKDLSIANRIDDLERASRKSVVEGDFEVGYRLRVRLGQMGRCCSLQQQEPITKPIGFISILPEPRLNSVLPMAFTTQILIMAINRASLSSQSITENTNSVIEMRSIGRQPERSCYPDVPGKLIGYFNGATGFVELYIVSGSGNRLLRV